MAKIGTNANCITGWPNLEPILVAILVVKFWTNTSGTTYNWPNLGPMHVAFYLAGEITQETQYPGSVVPLAMFCIYFASEYWITAKTCLKIWYSFKFGRNLHQTSAKRFVYLQQNLSFLQLPCLSNSGSVNSGCYLVKMILMINGMIIILMDIVHIIIIITDCGNDLQIK